MILLVTLNPLGMEVQENSFQIIKVSYAAQVLGHTPIMILKIEEEDKPELIRNVITRVKARVGKCAVFSKNGTVELIEEKDIKIPPEEFIDNNLGDLAKEILEWKNTGLLHGGCGGKLRELARIYIEKYPTMNMDDGLKFAEKRVNEQALRSVSRWWDDYTKELKEGETND